MNALKAWLKSLPLALGVPVLCWFLWILFKGISRGFLKSGLDTYILILIILGVTVCVHFVAYLITGLPIFLIYHRHPGEMIWHPAVALATGTVLGSLGFLVILSVFKTPLEGVFIGAAHGFATAIAAWLQRPRHHENTHHLP